ncbi:MAG: bactofilin family protein [Polyangiaceae bacterium]|jgi:cytoskeletal protein CcmA (bactofilin family)
MAANVTIIGRTTRVRGRLTGAADLEVQGFVEGEITVTGDVTIDATGMVGAGVHGRKLVVRGAVKGDLVGEEAVLLEDGSRVVGDVRAPRVAIAPGALVRGYVQTGQAGGARAAGSRAQAATSSTKTAVQARPAVGAVRPAPKPPAPVVRVAGASGPAASGRAQGARRPPPPIVPALKKARGQMTKKKEH